MTWHSYFAAGPKPFDDDSLIAAIHKAIGDP